MDMIFKALADSTRRDLLDQLRARDGQTLSDLCEISELSRFGVMKHLGVLEDASLITTRKIGRFKYHYLNTAALQGIADRWVEPLTASPLARSVNHLKTHLEKKETPMSNKPDFVMETYIETTPNALWEALTDKNISARYNNLAGGIQGDFVKGGSYRHILPNGASILSGEILDVIPEERLEMTFVPSWDGPDSQASRVIYEIETVGKLCKLTVLHFDIPESQAGVRDGWAKIISSLKSLLETGEALTFETEQTA